MGNLASARIHDRVFQISDRSFASRFQNKAIAVQRSDAERLVTLCNSLLRLFDTQINIRYSDIPLSCGDVELVCYLVVAV
jgi:hypothetical protein